MNAPRYLLDQMFNGLVDELRKAGVECETATQAITKSNDSRIGIPDQEILDYLQREGSGFTLVTADLSFARKCLDLGIQCIDIDQKQLVLSNIKSRTGASI